MTSPFYRCAVCVAVFTIFNWSAQAREKAPVEDRNAGTLESRLVALERAVAGQGLLDLANQVAELQREVRLMRGELENQAYLIEQLQSQQRQLLIDMNNAPVGEVSPPPGASPLPTPSDAGPTSSPGPVGDAATAADSAPDNVGSTNLDAADQVALTGTPKNSSPPKQVPPASEQVESAYQEAFNLLKSGEYSDSIAAFRQFLIEYPTSEYSDNAQYWLGEAFYVTDTYDQAISEYTRLIEGFPDSQKLTHAMLKIGYSLHAMGDLDGARGRLEALVRDYPDSTAAKLAKERLDRIVAEQGPLESPSDNASGGEERSADQG